MAAASSINKQRQLLFNTHLLRLRLFLGYLRRSSNCLGHKASNDRTTVNNGLEQKWKEAVVTYFKALSQLEEQNKLRQISVTIAGIQTRDILTKDQEW
jgi:hypothetical protein